MTASTSSPQIRLTSEERRRQAVEACASLIATRGYSSTSIRDISAQVGISTGTLLHHFKSKEDLLVATLLAVSESFHADARTAMERSSDPAEKLRLLVRAVLASPRHDVGWRVWMAFWHEAALNPALSEVASARNELWESVIASVIDEGREAGRLRSDDPAASASELAALLNGVAIQRYAEAGRWTEARGLAVVEKLIDDWAVPAKG